MLRTVIPLLLFLSAASGAHADAGAPGAWADPARACRVRVRLPAEPASRAPMCAQLRLDLERDLAGLGLAGRADARSFRLLERTPEGGTADVAVRVDEWGMVWSVPATPAGLSRRYELYFRVGSAPPGPPADGVAVQIPDFARDAYGHGWDFDGEDFEGVDTWGDRAENIRSRRVENGILKLDVTGDAYFIWGVMWGSSQRPRRPVSIDLRRYPVLEIRLRQSVARSDWRLFGRPGRGESLIQYGFSVEGTDWQTVRVDLRRQAGWHGVLTALRIDPSKYQDAHVEIDRVRLLSLQPVERSAVELLATGRAAARLALRLERAAPAAGSLQTLTVRAADAAGGASVGQPVRVWLAAGSGGALAPDGRSPAITDGNAVRGLTGADGLISVRYSASIRAGAAADRIVASAEFSPARSEAMAVRVVPGAPARYVLSPTRTTIVSRGTTRIHIRAQLADSLGNATTGGGRRLVWSAPGAALRRARTVTDATGAAGGDLVVGSSGPWVLRASVRDTAGFRGESGAICVLPAGPRQDPVRLLATGYFGAGRRAWMPLGGFYANWVGTPSADGEWNRLVSFVDASDAEIVAWLRFLVRNGVTAQRFMLRAHRGGAMEPMDVGGRVNRELFGRFLHYLDLARPFGLRFLLVLHEDYTKPVYFDGDALRRFALPLYAGQNLDRLPAYQRRFVRDGRLIDDIGAKYTDPDVIACQDAYTREIVGLLRGNPLVFGYELENEMVGCPASWANHQLKVIRSVDPTVPVAVSHSGGGLFTADPAWWRGRTAIDFYTPHLYPDPPSTSTEVDYGLAVDILMGYSRLAGPAFLGESSGDQFIQHPNRETRRWTMRDIIWFSLTNGAPGCFFWNARASEVAEFRLASQIVARIDWATFRRRRAGQTLAVSHPMDSDRWFQTMDGLRAYETMARTASESLAEGRSLDYTLGGRTLARGGRGASFLSRARDVMVSSGYQVRTLVRMGGGEALAYVRNHAGVERWQSPANPRTTQFLRRRAPQPLTVWIGLPGRFTVTVWDLDTGRREERTLERGQAMELGVTEHDFAIHLRR